LAASFLLGICADSADGADQLPEKPSDSSIKATLVEVVKNVASKLGNKPATCRKYYIHPTVMECFSNGSLRELAEKHRDTKSNYLYEQVVLALLTPLKKIRAKAA